MTTYDLTARRRYTREEKAAIVAESVREGAVSAVARRHRVAPAQLFRWKKEFAPASDRAASVAADLKAGPTEPSEGAKFVPAVIAPASDARRKRRPRASSGDARSAVEIAFPSGCVLKTPADIGEAALARLIKLLA